MTAPALLPRIVKNTDGARPPRSIPHSAAGSSDAGDFQKLIGQAQAGQKPAPSTPSHPSDKSDPTDPSDSSYPSYPSTSSASPPPTPDVSIAALFPSILLPPPDPRDLSHDNLVVGRAVLCPPPEGSATLTPAPTPDGGQRTARPTSPDPQLAAPKSGEGGLAIPSPDASAHSSDTPSVGRAVPCPPPEGSATLTPPPTPDGGQRTARPTSPDPQLAAPNSVEGGLAAPKPGEGGSAIPDAQLAAPQQGEGGSELSTLPTPLSPSPSGTPVALNVQRMKSASQKNDFAGSAAQKLPPEHPSAPALAEADAAIPAAKSRTPTSFSEPKDFAPQWLVLDTTAKGPAAPTFTTNVQAGSAPASAALAQVERLIGREVLLLRDSGAQSLAVSLKVDSQTSLFLQLTNHHGQIQVAVRCESGDAPALDAHWGQLRESLARQNVQLLPLEDKSVSSGHSPDLPAQTPGNSQHGAPAQHPPPRPPASKTEKPSDDAMTAAVGIAKSKTKARHYRGWEKWA